MKVSISLSSVAASLGYLAGVVGVILGALNIGALTPSIRQVITGIAGALVVISHHHVTARVAAKAPPSLP